ncbi:NAD(+) diphosphatase [Nakamurella endophytica]|uniref:NAD(+) diphosphatase n=1 Tax=Nakamurella endophytica TaxID=1748367 RepID=A0A917T280_9ACTN|nr:NAD(+) diphosphatase [Nakamurella endophytica]GGM07932.1 NADH pyrophosphatase [Nakamurella endophytica]
MTAAAPFAIPVPALSRGTVDRSEDLRHRDRLLESWRDGLLLTVDPSGAVAVREVDGTPRLDLTRAVERADGPPEDAVLVGRADDPSADPSPAADPGRTPGIDVWTVPGPVADGHGLRELGAVLTDTDAGLLTAAVAVLGWHRAGGYCPRCGLASRPRADGWARVCPNGHEEFPRTDPAVIVLVHDGADRMVLGRQPSWAPGRYSVLAGFVEAGESLEATVVREVAEEVGIQVGEVRYLGSQPWPFPRSLMVGFSAVADPAAPLRPRDGEIEDARWVDRATVRRVLAAGGQADGIGLPPSVSIARRMIEGWAAAG